MKMISLFCIIVIIAINAESSRLLLDPCTDYSTDQPTPKCNGDGQTCVTVLETDPQTGCPICDVFVGCGGTCGTNTCNNGDVCCNALCGICTLPGMNCIM
eukprot:48927_1